MPAAGSSLVILDCEGVLVDSEPISNRILAELLTEAGLLTSYEDSLRDYCGRSQQSCAEIAAEKLGRPLPEDFFARFDERFFAACGGELRAVEGIGEVLRVIAEAGFASCVASSGSHQKMRFTLGCTGLLPGLEGRIFSASEVARGKPHPGVFLHAAERMRTPPSRCCVVEDSPLGIVAARAAGMHVLGFASPNGHAILSGTGARRFSDMRDLPRLLVEIFAA